MEDDLDKFTDAVASNSMLALSWNTDYNYVFCVSMLVQLWGLELSYLFM